MGLCSTLLPILSNPWSYAVLLGVGIGGKLLYSYSSYTFIPSFLAVSNIIRIIGGAASIVNLAWKANLFVIAALLTTFSGTIKTLLSGNTNPLDVLMVAGGEIYSKIGLSVSQIVDGIGYLAQWLGQNGTACGLITERALLFSAFKSFWIGAAAYIFALRFYDWMYGKGMTREVEWPEAMMVIVAVTLFSILVGVLDGNLINEAVVNTESLMNALGQGQVDIPVNTSINNTTTG